MKKPSIFKKTIASGIAIFITIVRYGVTAQEKPTVLKKNQPIARRLAERETHVYEINLSNGQYLQASVEQKGADVVVKILDPTGKEIREVDSPTGNGGAEPVWIAARASGNYRIELRLFEKTKPGDYEIKIRELRALKSDDVTRIDALYAAIRVYNEVNLLMQQKSQDYAGVEAKLQEVLKEYRTAGVSTAEATILAQLAGNALEMKAFDKAMNYVDRSLALYKQNKSREGEAIALSVKAYIFLDKGEQDKAFEYGNLVLAIYRELGDRPSEARTLEAIGDAYVKIGDKQKGTDFYGQAIEVFKSAQLGLAAALVQGKIEKLNKK